MGVAVALVMAASPVNQTFAQQYGTGETLDVPYVAPGTIMLDGVMDEAAWESAPVINPAANWDGAWSGHPDADVSTEARLLFTTDTLYVYMMIEDYDLYFDGGSGDQILIGIDPVYEPGVTDTLRDDGFGGWPDNAPDMGPVTYKIWAGNDTIPGISLNFSPDIVPADSGWVKGTVFTDETTLTWGVEIAIYASQIAEGAQIGFNIGGASGKEEGIDDRGGEGTYAFFSWQSVQYPGGDVMHNAGSFATLNLGAATGTESNELPSLFGLSQNYPNPFNPATSIDYRLERSGHVRLTVYNTLGQWVETLVDGAMPSGAYSATWTAGNVPSGVYLYRLEVDGKTVSARKMLLLK